jgi:hypothetical protein
MNAYVRKFFPLGSPVDFTRLDENFLSVMWCIKK